MMAVLVLAVARDAKVKVVACLACDKIALWQDIDAIVASTSRFWLLWRCEDLDSNWFWNILFFDQRLDEAKVDLWKEGTWNFSLDFWSLAKNTLGCACDDLSVLDETLDKPVIFTRAGLSRHYAVLAEIVVSTITDAAVVMCICHCAVADIAVD